MSTAAISSGSSDTAEFLDYVSRETNDDLSYPASFSKQPAYDELAEMWEECSEPNWDSYNALPVEQDSIQRAYSFIEALPLGHPLPSVGAEPDGHVTLEWCRSPRWVLSVSVSPEGTLYYAALFGSSDSRGSEPFFDEVPENILRLIQRAAPA